MNLRHNTSSIWNQLPVLALAAVFATAGCESWTTAARAAEKSDNEKGGGWKAGAARVVITPEQPMWMSGYAGRDKPAEGKLTDLFARAIVIEDARGERACLICLDLVGIDRAMSTAICDQLKRDHGFERRQIAINCSHTHTGPVVAGTLEAMHFLEEAQTQLVRKYAETLKVNVAACVKSALGNMEPATLSWGQGKATFAVNRRQPEVEARILEFRENGQLKGPVDHAAPVLRVARQDGSLKAVVFGYACHATVLSYFKWSGDWPGFAMQLLEQNHVDSGAIALYWQGCGADQNPLPRRTEELAKEYGHRLAEVVESTMAGGLAPLEPRLATAYAELAAPFAELPSREKLEMDARSNDKYQASRARNLLKQIDAGKPLEPTYPYPAQVWRFGNEVNFVTLGGEVVIDFALRLKVELGPKTWIAGYTNDVMAYIPSRRVLIEGGYEGGGAMVYYGLPTTWGPDIEETIVRGVQELARQVDKK